MSRYSGYTCPNCDSTEGTVLNSKGHPSCAECGYEDPWLLEKQRERIKQTNRHSITQEGELSPLEALRLATQTTSSEGSEETGLVTES